MAEYNLGIFSRNNYFNVTALYCSILYVSFLLHDSAVFYCLVFINYVFQLIKNILIIQHLYNCIYRVLQVLHVQHTDVIVQFCTSSNICIKIYLCCPLIRTLVVRISVVMDSYSFCIHF